MKVQHGKDLANHSAPESCGDARESVAEALIGETGGSAIEPRNPDFGAPTQLSDAEGNMTTRAADHKRTISPKAFAMIQRW